MYISVKKEIKFFAPLPGTAQIKIYFFEFEFFINMEILIFFIDGPISNNKENINFAPPPLGTAPGKKNVLIFALIHQ